MSPVWMICIPTIPRRAETLQRVLLDLMPQTEAADACGMVQVVGWLNVGTPRIAEIRDRLVTYAAERGAEYISFVDDDDRLPEYYVAEGLAAMEHNPDHVGLLLDYWKNGEQRAVVEHRLLHRRWQTLKANPLTLVRDFTHIDPIKVSWARRGRFAEARPHQMEDRIWAQQLRDVGFTARRGATEVFINRIMYRYIWVPDQSAWDTKDKLTTLGIPIRPFIAHPYFTWHPESL